jgi:hypothetical protein
MPPSRPVAIVSSRAGRRGGSPAPQPDSAVDATAASVTAVNRRADTDSSESIVHPRLR